MVKQQCLNHPGILPMKSHKFRLQNLVQIGGFLSVQNICYSENLDTFSPKVGNFEMHARVFQFLQYCQK